MRVHLAIIAVVLASACSPAAPTRFVRLNVQAQTADHTPVSAQVRITPQGELQPVTLSYTDSSGRASVQIGADIAVDVLVTAADGQYATQTMRLQSDFDWLVTFRGAGR